MRSVDAKRVLPTESTGSTASPTGMVRIPGGTFVMGSNHHYPEEAPAHNVRVYAFWMDRHAVTNVEFKRFVDATGYVTLAEKPASVTDYPDAKPGLLAPSSAVFHKPCGPVDMRNAYNWWTYVAGADWKHPRGPDSSLHGLWRHPVVHVAFDDAEAYATWAGKTNQWFSANNLSSNGLVHMIMGGEVYLGDATTDQSWTIGRRLGLQIAAHILSPFGIRPIFDKLAARTGGNGKIAIGPDNLFIHMTGMSDTAWEKVKEVGAQVSIAFPIEMNMRHGMPPILRVQSLGMEPSLSVDVECTLTADFFTQMRACMNLQRALVNQMTLDSPTGIRTCRIPSIGGFRNPP